MKPTCGNVAHTAHDRLGAPLLVGVGVEPRPVELEGVARDEQPDRREEERHRPDAALDTRNVLRDVRDRPLLEEVVRQVARVDEVRLAHRVLLLHQREARAVRRRGDADAQVGHQVAEADEQEGEDRQHRRLQPHVALEVLRERERLQRLLGDLRLRLLRVLFQLRRHLCCLPRG